MNLRTRQRNWVRSTLLRSIFVMVGFASTAICAEDEAQANMTRIQLMDFAAYLSESLGVEVQKDLSTNGENHFIEQVKWMKHPLEIKANCLKGNVRIRFEEDFVIIWFHGNREFHKEGIDPSDVVRLVTKEFLGAAFVVGDPTTTIDSNATLTTKGELRMAQPPKQLSETGPVICSFYSASAEKRKWNLVDKMYLLVKKNDAIVVIEKLKARRLGVDNYIYEGLEAAKTGLATNTILNAENITGIPLPLLNGCMWSFEEQSILNVKDLGSVGKHLKLKVIGVRH